MDAKSFGSLLIPEVEFKIPTTFKLLLTMPQRRFRSSALAGPWLCPSIRGTDSWSPRQPQLTIWCYGCSDLRIVPSSRIRRHGAPLCHPSPVPLPITGPTCSSPSPSRSHRCPHFDKGSGHTGLWSTVASCGPPGGLCCPLTASVGYAVPGPGC